MNAPIHNFPVFFPLTASVAADAEIFDYEFGKGRVAELIFCGDLGNRSHDEQAAFVDFVIETLNEAVGRVVVGSGSDGLTIERDEFQFARARARYNELLQKRKAKDDR